MKNNAAQALLKPGKTYLTDGGLETSLIFEHDIELPHFAAFHILNNPEHRQIMSDYYRGYLDLAEANQSGFILESPTWRANTDWAFLLGYSDRDLEKANQFAIEEMKKLKAEYTDRINDILISGCVGPRGDGYQPNQMMTVEEAWSYHRFQIKALQTAGVDLVSGITLNYTAEAAGMTLAAQEQDIPIVISFTVETDGLLPNGTSLQEAIETVDRLSGSYPAYYMINCAHPEHFKSRLSPNDAYVYRIQGVRANASCKSHAELDESTELDRGQVAELAKDYQKLQALLPMLQVYGGCCGTDVEHIGAICTQLFAKEEV